MNIRFFSVVLLLSIPFLPSFIYSSDPSENAYREWVNGPLSDAHFFPIAVWLQSPDNALNYKEAGINTYVGLWRGPTEAQLKTLRDAGMKVICSQNEVGLANRNDPTIVGWMHQDEPDNAQPITDPETGEKTYGPPVSPQKVVDLYKEMQKADPTRPILLNLGQGVANDEWKGRGRWGKREDYFTYVKGCDILSFDVYPVVGIRKPDGENYLWYVAKGVDRLMEWSDGEKIIWNCIECTHISNPDKKATPHQVRAEVWMSIIHGSMGLIYFVHEFQPRFNEDALLDDPEMLAGVTELNRQIHSLAPILNTNSLSDAVQAKSSNPDAPVDIMTKRYDGELYVFSVGMRNAATDATFSLAKKTPATEVEVVNENRTIQIQDGEFIDHFDPYDVHIYRIPESVDLGILYPANYLDSSKTF